MRGHEYKCQASTGNAGREMKSRSLGCFNACCPVVRGPGPSETCPLRRHRFDFKSQQLQPQEKKSKAGQELTFVSEEGKTTESIKLNFIAKV